MIWGWRDDLRVKGAESMIWLDFIIPLPFVVKYYNYTTFLTDAGLEVKVKDPPKGMIPPGTQLVKPKADPQPNKVREGKIKRGILKGFYIFH